MNWHDVLVFVDENLGPLCCTVAWIAVLSIILLGKDSDEA